MRRDYCLLYHNAPTPGRNDTQYVCAYVHVLSRSATSNCQNQNDYTQCNSNRSIYAYSDACDVWDTNHLHPLCTDSVRSPGQWSCSRLSLPLCQELSHSFSHKVVHVRHLVSAVIYHLLEHRRPQLLKRSQSLVGCYSTTREAICNALWYLLRSRRLHLQGVCVGGQQHGPWR